jgi:Skp family chaperone for outer membrane proteins
MKLLHLFSLTLVLTLAGFLVPAKSSAQGPNIAVVDMQQCLNDFYKTSIEVEKVNALAKEKQGELDARKADYETLTGKATELQKRATDTALSAEQRQAAGTELNQVLQERMAKGREIAEAERRARTEILEARQKMESDLVSIIREVVNTVATAAGHDLVLDKSFLPKANKVILLVSDKVPDLTATVTTELNKDKPADAEAPPAEEAPAAPAEEAPATPGEEGPAAPEQ